MSRLCLLFSLALALLLTACSRSSPAPEALGDPSFSFAVIGDWGNSGSPEDEVSAAIADRARLTPYDAIVTTGDNAYPDGSPDAISAALDSYSWLADEGIPMFAALGNHDYMYERGDAALDAFEMAGRYYTVDLGDAQLFVLDSNMPDDSVQLDWLARELSTSESSWKIAVYHHPAFSCSRHGLEPSPTDDWLPLLEDGGVDLILNSHDHNYQRFAPSDGSTTVIGGQGGASLYEVGECSEDAPELVASNDQDHGFLEVLGDPSTLQVFAFDTEGDVLDAVELSADGE